MTAVLKRYDSLQVARIIGALLVVTYHFGAVELQNGAERLVPPLLTYAEMVIDLFFVVSGFLMGALYRETPGGVATVGEFALRRFLRIYPGYWLITLTVLIVWTGSAGRLFNNLVGPNPDVVSSLLLVPSATRPVIAVAWTLLHEVYFYAGFGLLLFLKPAWRPSGGAVWALTVVGGYMLLQNPHAHPGLRLIVSPYTLEFLAGVSLGWVLPHLNRHAPRLALILAGVLAVLLMVLTHFDPALRAHMPEVSRIAVDGATAFLICYGLVAADVTGLWSCPRPWVRAGDWSYALYLVHPAVIACVCFVWRRFSVPGLWDNAAVLVIVLVTCLSVAAQIFIRLERPTSRSAGAIMEALSRGMKRAMKPLAST